MPTRRSGPSCVLDSKADVNSRNAFLFPRTRLTGTTSPSVIVRIGLLWRSSPAQTRPRPTPPRRPPDWAAPEQVLDRVEGEEQPRAAAVKLAELVDLFVRRPALEPPLDR